MFQYFKHIYKLLQIVEENEAGSIKRAAELIVETILKKKSIYIFGASHAGILSQEMYYRAGGLIPVNPIFARDLMLDVSPITHTSAMERLEGYGIEIARTIDFNANDVLILHSVSGRNPVIIDLALEAKKYGVMIISITNLKYSQSTQSRHSSRKRLFELSDIVIDNHGMIGDAECCIQGIEQKVGPTSTVIGATILNTIVVEVTKKLVSKGISVPPIFYSANLDGGDELNQMLLEKYKEIIHYQF